MSSLGTLYGPRENPRVLRIRAVAAHHGQAIELVELSPVKGEQKNPAFLHRFPMGKIPAFELANGTALTESRAIARYLAAEGSGQDLLGQDALTSGQIEQWISFADDEILGPSFRLFHATKSKLMPMTDEQIGSFRRSLLRALEHLAAHILEGGSDRPFLVGHQLSLGDLTTASNLSATFSIVFKASKASESPSFDVLKQYYDRVASQRSVAGIFPNLEGNAK